MNGVLQGKVWDSAIKRQHKVLLALLSWYANEDGGNIFPSAKTLGKRLNVSERQIRRQLRELEEAGYIQATVRKPGHTNAYRIVESALPSTDTTNLHKPRTFSDGGHFHSVPRTFSTSTPDISAPTPDIHMSAELAFENRNREELAETWKRVVSSVKAKLNIHSFETWIKPLKLRSLANSVCVIEAPNPDFIGSCKQHGGKFQEAFQELGLEIASVRFVPRNAE